MSLTQQYALDVHRLSQQGQPPPPAPGTHEAEWLLRTLRSIRRAFRQRRALRRSRTGRGDAPPAQHAGRT